jgi:group I intron endonuclease
MPIIYKITNKVNNKSYIGYTKRTNVEHRIREHFSPSVFEKSDNPFYKAIRKYGKNSFKYEILFESDNESETLQKEIEYIKEFGDYNLHEGGNIPPNQTGKKWKLSDETKHKMRKPKPARTKEHQDKLSAALKGKIPWNKGKKGVQVSPWKGKRDSPRTLKWKIHMNGDTIITENLVLWCEKNGYNKNTVKGHYYNNSFPYKDIQKIEKVNNARN